MMRKRLIFSKILVIIIIAIALTSHHIYNEESFLNLTFEITGYILLGISAFGRTWAAAFISGKKSKKLITDGPYSIMRNPLYFFSLLGFIGAGLTFESLLLTSAFTAVFFLTHWPTILKEEQILQKHFGQPFIDYKKITPRFIPNLFILKNPVSINISPTIFSKVILESSLVLLVFSTAHTIEWLHIHGKIPILYHIY